jgi:hypothetical protein
MLDQRVELFFHPSVLLRVGMGDQTAFDEDHLGLA